MIDKEKIKSAARGYSEYTYGTLEEHPLIEEAYKEGANWANNEFLKDVWHPAEEEPMSNASPILFDGRDREGWQIVKTSIYRTSSWVQHCHYYGIIRWAYLEDLFPEEGGEQ